MSIVNIVIQHPYFFYPCFFSLLMVTKVIGLRITTREKLLWTTYADAYDITIPDLLALAIRRFLSPYTIFPLHSDLSTFIHSLDHQLSISALDTLVPFTFRISPSLLEQIDSAVEEYLFTRTIFIRQAMKAFFYPSMQQELKTRRVETISPLKLVLYNVIHRLNEVPYQEIMAIFNSIDKSLLRQMLESLEQEGKILRNWHDTYMTSEKHATMEDTVAQLDQEGRL